MKRASYLVTTGHIRSSLRSTAQQRASSDALQFSTAQLLKKEEADAKGGGPIDHAVDEAKELQARTPWHREGSDKPPVKQLRSAGAMTKGLFSYILIQTNINYHREAAHDSLKVAQINPSAHFAR